MAKVNEGSRPAAPAVQPEVEPTPTPAAQPDTEAVQSQATAAQVAHARAINRAEPSEGEDAGMLGVDASKVPDTPPDAGVAQIITTVQSTEGAIGDIEVFSPPGAPRIVKPREEWVNPTDQPIVVAVSPPFRVRPGGRFTIEKAYHEAVHNAAPQLHCPLGTACTAAIAHQRMLDAAAEEKAQRAIARAILKE